MRNDITALRMCYRNSTETFELPSITSQMIIQNPSAAARMFYRLLSKFFEIIVKLPVQTFTGRNMNFDELLKKENFGDSGAFGSVTAHYGVLEEQKGGNLHYHGMLFGAWNVRLFQQWCHSGNAAKMFQKLIDAHVTCKIPKWLKMKDELYQHLQKENKQGVKAAKLQFTAGLVMIYLSKINLLQPYPEATHVETEAAILAVSYNHHKHSSTCRKQGKRKCRLAMPQPQAQKTFFTEIVADYNGQPIRKHEMSPSGNEVISNPPVRGANAFSVKDKRIIVGRLACSDLFEKMQVEINPITTALLRCNTSMQVLITESQAKAAAFYIAQYMSKQPYLLQNMIPLILQAEEQFRKYGTKATDAQAADRKAKNILQKCLNKHDLLEVSDQQAAAAVLGYDSFISSHKFAFVEPWKAVCRHRELQGQSTQADEDGILEDLEIEHATGKAISVSTLDRYFNRGKQLQMYSLYMYTLMIGHRKPLKKTKQNSSTRGRSENPTFPYKANSKASKCFEQMMRSTPTIPRIAGQKPPAYPGDKPTDLSSSSRQNHWESQAKTFVEFYSLLFLPFDENTNLLKPYDSILPWNSETSWDDFWQVFNAFENAKSFYGRSVWFIFHNMVDNMDQHPDERTLVTKWRFMEADELNDTFDEKRSAKHPIKPHKQKSIEDESDECDFETLQVIIEQIRDEHGSELFLSPKQRERKKARAYLRNQINNYLHIHQINPQQTRKITKFNKYTHQECEMLSNVVLASDVEKDEDVEMLDQRQVTIEMKSNKEVVLNQCQQEAVEKLKQIRRESIGSSDLKPGQLLAFIQGAPGSGKTETAKQLAKKLGLNALYSGTTGTAAAQLKAETINKVLGLRLNLPNFIQKKVPTKTQQKIIQKFEDVQLLVIDEASMLTPVTLTKINTYLKQSLKSEHLFGGLSVILIGDFDQFPPVERGLKNPALYQAAVMLAQGMNMPNEAYRVGAEIFTKFRLVILKGQVRASPEFEKWLNEILESNDEFPITDVWLSKLTTLKKTDFLNEEIDWNDATIVVSGNLERYKFLLEKIKIKAKLEKQPILRWVCPIKVGKNKCKVPTDFDPEDVFPQIVKYFVRGAKCVLTESIDTKLGLGKGTEGIYLDAVWKDDEKKVNLDELPIGEVRHVTQPDYIVMQFGDIIRAVKPKITKFDDAYGVKKNCLAHECELAAAVTFHKMQGKTAKSIILSLNSTTKVSKKIFPVSLHSLYVGCSRVHDHAHLRVLPLSKEDKEYLKTLKWDPRLRMFFDNFDETGKWKPHGLQKHRDEFTNLVKLKLGMVDLPHLTVAELKKFAADLDLIVSKKPTKQEYIRVLSDAHAEGKKILMADDAKLLKFHRSKLMQELRKKKMKHLKLKDLRHYAKNLGVKNCMNVGRAELKHELNQILNQTKVSNTDCKNSSIKESECISSEDAQDVENDELHFESSEKEQTLTSSMDAMDVDDGDEDIYLLTNEELTDDVQMIEECKSVEQQNIDSANWYIPSKYELQEAQQMSRDEAERRFVDDLNEDLLEADEDWEEDDDLN